MNFSSKLCFLITPPAGLYSETYLCENVAKIYVHCKYGIVASNVFYVVNKHPQYMHARDFASQTIHHGSKQFPKAFEGQQKPRMKIPDFPSEIEKDQSAFLSFDTSIQPPPLSTTDCFITETANTNPNMLRSTMYILPAETDLFDSMELPFALVVTPFSGRAIPVELKKDFAVKCKQCCSYVNTFTRFEENFFYCNICNCKNATKGLSANEMTRYPTVEYIGEYESGSQSLLEPQSVVSEDLFRVKVTAGPAFIFGIDLNATGLLAHIKKAIRDLIMEENFRFLFKNIGVILFSGKVTVIKLLCGEIVEISLPGAAKHPFISPEFLMDTGDEGGMRSVVEYIEHLSPMKADEKTGLRDCLRVATSMTRYCGGSKVAVFTNSMDEMEFESLSRRFVDFGGSLSIFSTQKVPAGKICALTTGRCFVYGLDSLTILGSDLLSLGTTKSSYRVQVEVKTSDAVRKYSFYGNTLFENLCFQDFAQMDGNTTFCTMFSLEENLKNQSKAYAQVIVNFCAFDGSRRTLVMNIGFTASSKLHDVYAGISFDTIACVYAKYISTNSKDAKERCKKVEDMLSRSLKFYRESCCREASSFQFVLPESIKLVPLVYQSMLKNSSFSNDVCDIELARITNFTVEQNLRFFYPRLFPFTDFYMDRSLNKVKTLRLTIESLSSSEVYVMENSQKIYLYVGCGVDPSLKDAVVSEGTEENSLFSQILEELCSHYDCELPVVLVEEGKGGAEVEFIGYMVEDRLNDIPSYQDYVCELHFKVKNA